MCSEFGNLKEKSGVTALFASILILVILPFSNKINKVDITVTNSFGCWNYHGF